ncbi:MAG TPA: GDP-mannose 4,6-dehydratase [Desulfotomaculum sp.]|nr:GDP-mannose 4,6-dehydratase [Desulfotomaculum sp.]
MASLNNQKIVITGGAGFIGSHLAEELYPANEVIILDNLFSGKLENIEPFLNYKQVSFFQGSVTDLSLLSAVFKGVDYVFHQAAITSVPRSIADPLNTDEVNIQGTLNVLLAARDNRVKKVIYASSSSVYGGNPSLPQKEELPLNPLSPYAVTKLAGELYCGVFTAVYGLPTVCLRYFNVFGPRQDPDSQYAAVIPIFIKKLMVKEPPEIYGDGEQVRDFTFVKDVVQANVLAAVSEITGPVNVGTGKTTSVNKLAEILIELTGNQTGGIHLRHTAPRPADPRQSQADISKAQAFGYSPGYGLKEGLEITGQFFKK